MGAGSSKADPSQTNANTAAAVGVGMAPRMEVMQQANAYFTDWSPVVAGIVVVCLAIGLAAGAVCLYKYLTRRGRRNFLRNYGVPQGYAERRSWRSRFDELGVDKAVDPKILPGGSTLGSLYPKVPSQSPSSTPHSSIPMPQL